MHKLLKCSQVNCVLALFFCSKPLHRIITSCISELLASIVSAFSFSPCGKSRVGSLRPSYPHMTLHSLLIACSPSVGSGTVLGIKAGVATWAAQ